MKISNHSKHKSFVYPVVLVLTLLFSSILMADHVMRCPKNNFVFSCCKDQYLVGYNNKWINVDYRNRNADEACDDVGGNFDEASGQCGPSTDIWTGSKTERSAEKYCDGYVKID